MDVFTAEADAWRSAMTRGQQPASAPSFPGQDNEFFRAPERAWREAMTRGQAAPPSPKAGSSCGRSGGASKFEGSSCGCEGGCGGSSSECSSSTVPHPATQALEWGVMHSEGITDPFMRAAMIGETLRTAPARNGDSIWSDYDAMITATQALHEVRTQGSVALPRLQAAVFSSGNSGDSGLNAQSDDYLASVKVNDIEDLMNLVLDTFVHRFIFTCRCALEYREIVVFVWDDRKQRWRPKRFCRVIVTCAGTWAWCNFKIDVWVPCGYWWDPLPPCPPTREQMKQAMREGYDKGTDIQFVGTTDVVFGGRPIMVDARVPGKGVVTWCDEGHNSHHPEADVCYRQVVTELGPGQQCCYKGGNLLTGGTSASTPDKVGSAAAVKSNGACVSNAAWVAEHVKQDVAPWDLRGVRAVGEAWYGPNDDDPRFNEWPPSGSETEKRFLEDLKPWAPPGW